MCVACVYVWCMCGVCVMCVFVVCVRVCVCVCHLFTTSSPHYQLLRLLLRINASVSDILAVNISLANQSLLLTAANNALTASISAR